MTDKELLEMAAKAAGLLREYCGGEFTDYGVFLMPIPERPDFSKHGSDALDAKPIQLVKWNPLTDDGDALRLAVKLNLSICTGPCQSSATSIDGALDGFFPKEDSIYQCQYAATRRAIVRAAAAIGEKL